MHRYQKMAWQAEGRAVAYAFKGSESYVDGNLRMGRYWTARALEEAIMAGEWRGMYSQYGTDGAA